MLFRCRSYQQDSGMGYFIRDYAQILTQGLEITLLAVRDKVVGS